jgi:hypothetical protein
MGRSNEAILTMLAPKRWVSIL